MTVFKGAEYTAWRVALPGKHNSYISDSHAVCQRTCIPTTDGGIDGCGIDQHLHREGTSTCGMMEYSKFLHAVPVFNVVFREFLLRAVWLSGCSPCIWRVGLLVRCGLEGMVDSHQTWTLWHPV